MIISGRHGHRCGLCGERFECVVVTDCKLSGVNAEGDTCPTCEDKETRFVELGKITRSHDLACRCVQCQQFIDLGKDIDIRDENNPEGDRSEQEPPTGLAQGFQRWQEGGKKALTGLILKNKWGAEKERMLNGLAPEDVPLPPSIEEGLFEIARIFFFEEGRTNVDELADEFEEVLGEELFDKVADFLPDIIETAAKEASFGEFEKPMPTTGDIPLELAGRFGLDEKEVALLVSTYIADGRWCEMELTEDQGADYLEDFIKLWNPDSLGIPFGTAVFCQTQNTLMAMKKDDFLTIQEEPPFSRFGEQNLTRLTIAWLSDGHRGFRHEFGNTFGSPSNVKNAKRETVTYSGGPGDSAETAVTIHAYDNEIGVRAEYWYLYYTYGRDWQFEAQALTERDKSGRTYDILDVQFTSGELARFYFEVTEFADHDEAG